MSYVWTERDFYWKARVDVIQRDLEVARREYEEARKAFARHVKATLFEWRGYTLVTGTALTLDVWRRSRR